MGRAGDTSRVCVAKAAKLPRGVRSEVEAKLRLLPIYEYKCPKGHVFEVFQKMTDPPQEVCETCGEGPGSAGPVPGCGPFQGVGLLLHGLRPRLAQASRDGEKSDSGGEKSDKGDKKDVKKVAESSSD